jgi:hypothetical protein
MTIANRPRTDSRKIDRLLDRLDATNLDVSVEVTDRDDSYGTRWVWITVKLNTYDNPTMLGVYERSKSLHIGFVWDRKSPGSTPRLAAFTSHGWSKDEDLTKGYTKTDEWGTHRYSPGLRQRVAVDVMVSNQAVWDTRQVEV